MTTPQKQREDAGHARWTYRLRVSSTANQALVEMGAKHGRDVRLVHPAHTTMDCADCGARAKHRLALSERTYTCTACGISRPRDKNSTLVVLDRAGLSPAGIEGVRPGRPQDDLAA